MDHKPWQIPKGPGCVWLMLAEGFKPIPVTPENGTGRAQCALLHLIDKLKGPRHQLNNQHPSNLTSGEMCRSVLGAVALAHMFKPFRALVSATTG